MRDIDSLLVVPLALGQVWNASPESGEAWQLAERGEHLRFLVGETREPAGTPPAVASLAAGPCGFLFSRLLNSNPRHDG
jgi:hypothetical protein